MSRWGMRISAGNNDQGPHHSARSRGLVVFDLDGTLTRLDTLPFFLVWVAARRPWRIPLFLRALAPLFKYYLALGAAADAKQALIGAAVAGLPANRLDRISASFVRRVIPWLARPRLMTRLRAHTQAGDEVWLASAAPHPVCSACAKQWGLAGGFGTRLESIDGRLTGRFQGANCVAEEKVRRLHDERAARPSELQVWMAYGDDPVRDGPLLAAAKVPVLIVGPLPKVPAWTGPITVASRREALDV